jgi:23S rRNA (adenine2503-C2)-methyltransferase
VGLVPQLRKLGQEIPVNLAISLHAPDNATRTQLMPINKTFPLEELMAACREYPIPSRKRITFEYLLIDGLNDQAQHARQLIKCLHGIRAKVNLIPFNAHSDSPYGKPSEEQILAFQDVLKKTHLTVTIRQSRGADIGAACGQLVAKAGG